MRYPLILLLVAAPIGAQTATKVAIRPLPAPTATSTETVRSLAAVRQLANGNVLVNDQAGRRVVLMDSMLKVIGVVADSTTSTASAYGPRPGGLIAYRGDSTLFVDPASLSMLVIDPAGKVARVMAAPRPNDVMFLTGGAMGTPGFDAKGRLVYRSFTRPSFIAGGGPSAGAPPVLPDSEAIVRFDLATRKLDTAAFFKVYRPKMNVERDSTGVRMTSYINPLPVVDEWVVMADGSIAIVRGRDYRVDFVSVDGAATKGEKLPYDWQRLTDEDKAAFIDSTKAAMTRARAAGGAPGGANAGFALGGAMAGASQMVIRMEDRSGPGGPPPGGAQREQIVTGGPPAGAQLPPLTFVSPSELPDYKPVFGPGAVRADADGNLWVRTIPTKPTTGVVYDVIDRSGKLVDRVLVPSSSVIVGFGAGGVVYMGTRDAAGIHVQRAHMK